jgi:hypothetical protein
MTSTVTTAAAALTLANTGAPSRLAQNFFSRRPHPLLEEVAADPLEEPLPPYPLVAAVEEEVAVVEVEAEAFHLPPHQELLEENLAATHLPNSRGTAPWQTNS